MLKVCHIISGDLWAGPEVQTYQLLKHLSNEGVEVVAVVLNDRELAKKLKQEEKIKTYVIDESRNGFFSLAFKLHRIIKDEKPDILHSHRYKENILASIGSLFHNRLPCIKTVHGLREDYGFLKSMKVSINRIIDDFFSKLSNFYILAVSRDIQSQLAKAYNENQISFFPNSIAVSKYVQKEVYFKESEIRLLYLGRLEPVKGVDILIKAFSLLSTDKYFLSIGGGGSQESYYKKLSKDFGLSEKIEFLGFVTDVSQAFNQNDILIIPSRHEGLPIVMLEAMAVGIPIIAANVGGMAEVLENEETAILFEKENETSLASAIKKLAIDNDLARSIATNARKKVLNYDLKGRVEELIGKYETLKAKN